MKRVTIFISVFILFVSYTNISFASEESVPANGQESIRPLQFNQNDLWVQQRGQNQQRDGQMRGFQRRGQPQQGQPQQENQEQMMQQWMQRGNNQNQEQNQEQGQQEGQEEQSIQEEEMIQDTNIPDDPNEIKARVKTFEGLGESIEEVSNASMSRRQWRLIENDNRTGLVRAIQRQLENELEFINSTALSEDANDTMQICGTLLETRKEQSRIVLVNLNQQSREQQRETRTTRTTNRTQRTTGRTSRTQNYNTQQDNTTFDTNMQQTSDDEEEGPQYDEETQSEIDLWLNADVTNFDQRSNLAQTVNNKIEQDFNSIRIIALEEEADKTVAAIDGLFLARLERYAQIEEQNQKQRERLEAQQETSGNTTGNTSARRRR